jgi:hypothetical protein
MRTRVLWTKREEGEGESLSSKSVVTVIPLNQGRRVRFS